MGSLIRVRDQVDVMRLKELYSPRIFFGRAYNSERPICNVLIATVHLVSFFKTIIVSLDPFCIRVRCSPSPR